ncbi:Glycerol-3-phosphate acyltransferase 1, mitochondrial [Triplophysa tibetana]|uniref:Glycerol-3-phosphate acyltransferase 1, mitochondrial n=1 Tax=Triplophysa tibetana TaxID=1572043 RepID=A0A5A9NUF1_9TELE|nr:Glycerol-3-phosphate acyltransferase 1, mitochondrial [Triplophysa tibetana]
MDVARADASSEGATMVQPRRPALSWGVKIRRKLKSVAPFQGRFRPMVGQCCHQCTPQSLGMKLLCNSPPLGFQNLTCVNETHTRYRGWLVRRVCCMLFVWDREVHLSHSGDRRHNVLASERVKQALSTTCGSGETRPTELMMPEVTGYFGRLLDLTETFISPTLLRLVSWVMLKFFSLIFCSVQLNLNQMGALHRATRQKTPIIYVCVRQSPVDHALICLTLFCHNLRVPYTLYPAQVQQTWLRSILKRLGVILLPKETDSERDAEMDSLYSPVMTSFIGELLREGAGLSVGVSAGGGQGGQWLARVRQAITDGLVPNVNVVPVAVSYDCLPRHFIHPKTSLMSALRFVVSLLKGDHRGSVRIHFAQAFSLKEMCESGKCRVDGGRPLQELLLSAVLHERMDSIFGTKDVSWILPPSVMPELTPAERQQTIALTLHLMYSSTKSMAVMSTSLVACLLLHKHHKGVRVSALCRDICWLLEEVLFRNTDVGYGGSLVGLVHHALSMLRPHLLIAAAPPTREPVIVPRPNPESLLTLSQHCDLLTHIFIHAAVGACAISAMLREVVGCGGGGDLEFDVVLGQDELMEKILQLTHLLSPGYIPPCQTAHGFALDAVDCLVQCGVLVMEEVQRETPMCDFMKRQGVLSWRTSDNPDQSSDSDCDEPDAQSYKLSQPSQCPEMLFFLCSLLSAQLRALCWTLESLRYLPLPITETACVSQLHMHLKNRAQLDKVHYESSSIDLVRMALRTFIDLGVLIEDTREDVYLDIGPLFTQCENKEKLLQFFSQFLYK